MKKITISNFKGIKSPLQLDLYTVDNNNIEKESNLLLYAENGGGKTSISEAIRLISFANFIEEEVISPNIVGEEREAAKRDWLNSYLHDQSNDVFEIDIDGNKFSSTSPDAMPNKNVFILDRLQLRPTSKIKLENLIGKNHFGGPYSYEQLSSSEIIDMVLSDVNDILKNEFKEKIELVRPESEEKIVGISGIIEGIITENIHEKLNEAHQNLIKILIFISYVKLAPKLGDEKKYFVVFDDVMSSLDLANRIVLARILINLGKEYQLLLMTHNVGFYNLIKHISGINHTNENWRYTSLYQIDGTHIMYSISEEENVDELVKKFGGRILPTDELAINAMRKKFEKLLHEFGIILTIGVQEETSDLIDRICNNEKWLYCYLDGDKIYTQTDLIKNISSLVKVCPQKYLQSKIRAIFQKYNEGNQMPWISTTIQHLHTYQKVVLHQGSHDQLGTLPIISDKEITITLDLMKKLEQIIKRSSTNFPYFI